MRQVDLLIAGGGPAGMAAALAAEKAGCANLLIVEKEPQLGGILRQCIHCGFGLHRFREELTGPEYAARDVQEILTRKIPYQCDTMILSLQEGEQGKTVVTITSPQHGVELIEARAVVLAMGCRERPRGMLGIPGSRCAGIYSAGTAQRLVNLDGYLPGKKVVILGSGDIGLIMARRMVTEGAQVLAVLELLPYSSGLRRNIVQCLDDYGIPLLLSHTVVQIHGQGRLSGVTIAKVDEKRQPIPGTEQYLPCDTLLLSCGLIPANELSTAAGVKLDSATAGPEVNQSLECSRPGIFACGNVLHVHDLVDHVSEEGARAGEAAVAYLKGQHGGSLRSGERRSLKVLDGPGVRGVTPRWISLDAKEGNTTASEQISLMFRPAAPLCHGVIELRCGERILKSWRRVVSTPGEMEQIVFERQLLAGISAETPLVCSLARAEQKQQGELE